MKTPQTAAGTLLSPSPCSPFFVFDVETIKKAVPGATDGTANLLQGLSDESEMRANYKMQQRVS